MMQVAFKRQKDCCESMLARCEVYYTLEVFQNFRFSLKVGFVSMRANNNQYMEFCFDGKFS